MHPASEDSDGVERDVHNQVLFLRQPYLCVDDRTEEIEVST